jgi:hypothetical protein
MTQLKRQSLAKWHADGKTFQNTLGNIVSCILGYGTDGWNAMDFRGGSGRRHHL